MRYLRAGVSFMYVWAQRQGVTQVSKDVAIIVDIWGLAFTKEEILPEEQRFPCVEGVRYCFPGSLVFLSPLT